MNTSTPMSTLPPSSSAASSPSPSLPTALSFSFPSISLPSLSLPTLSLPTISLPSLPLPSSSAMSLSAPLASATPNTTQADGSTINVPFLVGCIVGSIGGLSLSIGGLLFFLYRRQRLKDLEEKEESQRRLDLAALYPSPDAEKPEDKTVGAAVLTAQHSRLADPRDRETYTDAGRLPPGRRGAVSQSSSEVFRIFRNGTPEV